MHAGKVADLHWCTPGTESDQGEKYGSGRVDFGGRIFGGPFQLFPPTRLPFLSCCLSAWWPRRLMCGNGSRGAASSVRVAFCGKSAPFFFRGSWLELTY